MPATDMPLHYAGAGKRYLLNSAVMTAEGLFRYRLVTAAEAKAWAAAGPWQSTIGYEQTADALSVLLGMPIAVDRRTITMQPGDEALVFRLALPPGTARIDPGDKGRLAAAVMAGQYELGLLTRVE